ncbi:hypothetical protein [Rhizobium tubonense]|nr:hypothetical protein [Rhizobium tubonense]
MLYALLILVVLVTMVPGTIRFVIAVKKHNLEVRTSAAAGGEPSGDQLNRTDSALPESKKYRGRPYVSTAEKIRRFIYLVILFTFSICITGIFDTDWVAVPLLLLNVGLGIGELNGMSIFPIISRCVNGQGDGGISS